MPDIVSDRQATPVDTQRVMNQFNPSEDFLGDYAQSLIDCNQKLKDLGINDTIKLPQICVIGDQSAGKSSLIEALSKIKVPKADGCCTQCPIAINLMSGSSVSSPWTCSVSVEQIYDFIPGKRTSKANPLGPWQKRDETNIVNLGNTQDKDRVRTLIEIASTIALDPGCNPAIYLQNPDACKTARKVSQFSPNIIKIDVAEGLRPNLSFVDLPGVIANTAKHADRYLVTLVENLVRQYASDERSVNMLALPMTADVETSTACRIIQDLRVESRTLAVFTKPDCVDEEKQQYFIKRFFEHDNEQLDFQEGYHFVSMHHRANDDQSARVLEQQFFNQPLWAALHDRFGGRLGIPALGEYLRKQLFKKTAAALPGNLNAIALRLDQVQKQLSALPAPPNESQVTISLQQDLSCLRSSIEKAAHVCMPAWNDNASEFRDQIVGNPPVLILETRQERTAMRSARNVLERKQNGEDAELSEDEASPPIRSTQPQGLKDNPGPMYKFRLEEIRQINKAHRSAFVPGEIEPKAIEKMSKLSVQFWPDLLAAFMTNNGGLLHAQVLRVLKQSFGKHQHLEIFGVVEQWLKDYVNEAIQHELTLADSVCVREVALPYTLDQDALKEKEQRVLVERRKKRLDFRADLLAAQLNAREGKVRVKRDETKEVNMTPDEYDVEVQISSKVKAYYEVAASRFVDVICQNIFYRLLPKCGSVMIDELSEYLGINDPERHPQVIAWMAEDKEREALRQRLLRERQHLMEGHRYIQEVLGKNEDVLLPGIVTNANKRLVNENEQNGDEDESPTKRTKLAHRLSEARLSPDDMDGVEDTVQTEIGE